MFVTVDPSNVGSPNINAMMVVDLGSTRDGKETATATCSGSPCILQMDSMMSGLSLGSPVVVGDVLYVRMNTGLAAFDLRPLWQGKKPLPLPTLISATATGGTPMISDPFGAPLTAGALSRLIVDGTTAFLFAGDYRLFDLR